MVMGILKLQEKQCSDIQIITIISKEYYVLVQVQNHTHIQLEMIHIQIITMMSVEIRHIQIITIISEG